tara:strand:+ start:507 stop:1433 length:927 start_codon:yes stop_codon:yes gene_type:complete
MLKNIAVMVRGHLRTWDYNAIEMFRFFESIAENVDYYCATWRTPGLRHSKLRIFEDKGQTLKCQIVAPAGFNYSSWQGPALLSTLMAPHLREQHAKTPYDAVFDTRFDVMVCRTGKAILPIEDDTLYTNAFTNLRDRYGTRNIGMRDHMLVSSVDVYCMMADRIVIPPSQTKECHVDILEFAQRKGFATSNSLNWLVAEMVRPCDLERVKEPCRFFDHKWEGINHDIPMWNNCTIEQRIDLLDYYNIEHYDYITDNGNIAVREKGDDINEEVQQTGNSDRKWNGGISDLRLGQGPIDSDSELDNSDNL